MMINYYPKSILLDTLLDPDAAGLAIERVSQWMQDNRQQLDALPDGALDYSLRLLGFSPQGDATILSVSPTFQAPPCDFTKPAQIAQGMPLDDMGKWARHLIESSQEASKGYSDVRVEVVMGAHLHGNPNIKPVELSFAQVESRRLANPAARPPSSKPSPSI